MHQRLKVLVTADDITLEPESLNVSVAKQTLVFDRATGSFSLTPTQKQLVATGKTVAGLLGVIHLNGGPHLLLISEADRVGRIVSTASRANGGSAPELVDVYRLKDLEILPVLKTRPATMTARAKEDDRTYIGLLRDFVLNSTFYFSYDHDLTRAAQFQDRTKAMLPLHERVDDRFFWNTYVMRDLIHQVKNENDLAWFILPVMKGFVSIKTITLNNHVVNYALITRLGRTRAGARYQVRGIDVDGQVANFNETEQLVWLDSTMAVMSFLQVRGSIPLFWRQVTNLKYKPKLVIEDPARDAIVQKAASIHFDELAKIYGGEHTLVVNLIDQKGYELKIAEAFDSIMGALNIKHVRYENFDFHKECKHMRYDRLQVLINRITPTLREMNFYYCHNNETKSEQRSIIRTNCVDCLDRTNVVQAQFARYFLLAQLIQVNILAPSDRLENHADLESMLRNIWADNADAVSMSYSGTGALKTDYTRTGKRTRVGAIQDGINSAVRYVRGNFLDGWKQDAVDLFLGHYRVNPDEPSPLVRPQRADVSVRVRVLPLVSGLSLIMLAASLFLPAGTWLVKAIYITLWTVTFTLSTFTMFRYGTDFVNKPRLFNPVTGHEQPLKPLQ